MHYKLGLSFKEIFYRIFSRSVNHLNDNCLNLRGPTRIAYEVLSYLVETTYRSGKINFLKIVLFSTLHFQFSYLLFISYTYNSSFCKLINTNRHVHKCECVLLWSCNLNITRTYALPDLNLLFSYPFLSFNVHFTDWLPLIVNLSLSRLFHLYASSLVLATVASTCSKFVRPTCCIQTNVKSTSLWFFAKQGVCLWMWLRIRKLHKFLTYQH